jgi:hypothetical protein
MLALHVESDLPDAAGEITSRHLESCEDCRQFLDELRVRQSLLKSLRRHTVSSSESRAMRGRVMSIINERRDASGWLVRMERAIVLGVRQRSYALATVGLVALVSVSVLAQMRHVLPGTAHPAAVFRGQNTLLRPEGYRGWVPVGQNVYMTRSGYQEYARTGTFPEGTIMVWESVPANRTRTDHPYHESSVLLISVKSTRFDGGWGFFDFTGFEGMVTSEAQALPESSGCRACHRQDAETDHVFTQFYPVLRSAGHGAQVAAAPGSAT